MEDIITEFTDLESLDLKVTEKKTFMEVPL
jgi:hypothetical protein